MPLETSLIGKDVYPHRRQVAMAEAQKRGLDALLVWGRGGEIGQGVAELLYYSNHFSAFPTQPPAPELTGYEHAGLIIKSDGSSILLAGGAPSPDAVVEESRSTRDLNALLVETLRELGLSNKRVGLIGSEIFPYLAGRQVHADLPNLRFVPVDEISSRQRMRLEGNDALMLRNAGDVGTRLVEAIMAAAAPGITEGQAVGAGLAAAAQAPGCINWNLMVSSGPDQHQFVRNGTPGWNPSYVYQPGDILHVDAYGFVFGYEYDLMRTIVVGAEPTASQKRAITAARDLMGDMARGLRPGVTTRSLYQLGLDSIRDHGVICHATTYGHGLNCGWDVPWLEDSWVERDENDWAIEAPYAFAFETFLTDGEGSFAKWEEMYTWLPGGVERTTGGNPGVELYAPLPW